MSAQDLEARLERELQKADAGKKEKAEKRCFCGARVKRGSELCSFHFAREAERDATLERRRNGDE
jgi:hypothetical protein